MNILMYHSLDASGSAVSVSPQAFADQMAFISDMGFRGMSLREAARHREMNGSWPGKSVVITFDDGFANFHEHGLGPLSRLGFTATVFLISNFIGAHNLWDRPPHGLGTRPMLSWRQINELVEAGMEIGAHTHNHPNLRGLSEAKVEYEIVNSRMRIEDGLSATVESFAYPYGAVSRVALKVASREFRSACTTVLRSVQTESVHLLPRVDMYYVRSLDRLSRLLNGRLGSYLTFRRTARTLRALWAPNPDLSLLC